jgi:hypothetical protein
MSNNRDDDTRRALALGAATFGALLRAVKDNRHMDAVTAINGFNENKLKWVLTAAVLAGELVDPDDWPAWADRNPETWN